ncbi:MAG TPA: FdtA/QdtA family cupin domain-containing protein [Bacteroidales bacterium]|nr:FdtA/QdtA family cupin domain-containing protein [Bacteroidales bacterium]
MNKASIDDCVLLKLPCIEYRAGNISFVENGMNFPFEIKRVFYIYDIPGGLSRGAHALKTCHQLLIAVSGSFDVEMDDGINRKIIALKSPSSGLYIPPGIWATEKDFSSGSVCLVIASSVYSEDDYIRDYDNYKIYTK